MNEDLLREDWHKKLITAGDLYDIFYAKAQNGMANQTKTIAEKKCSVLTPTEIRERMGFRHICGGGVIGCRCRENWEERLSDSELERLDKHMAAYRDYIKEN